MNRNTIVTEEFSNPESEALYHANWPAEPAVFAQYEDGQQCGGCAFFAPFNADYGLCCNPESRHVLETVFEHFTCPALVNQGWGAHSFRKPLWACEDCGGFGDTTCHTCAGNSAFTTGRSSKPEDERVLLECWHDGCRAPLDDPVHMDLGAAPEEHAFVPALGVELQPSLTQPPVCPHCGIALQSHARGRECPSRKSGPVR
jgi:hypothetical protein